MNQFLGGHIMKVSQSFLRRAWKLVVLAALLVFLGWVHPASVSAGTEYNQWIPFTDDFDGCSGERITVDGVQHIVGRFTRDSNGKLHFGFTRNTIGKGIGQVSGASYIMTDSVTRSSLEISPGEPLVFMEGYRTILSRRGEEVSGDDTIIHFLSKITVTANGEVSAEIAIQSVECR
jgi:hypothetical protein